MLSLQTVTGVTRGKEQPMNSSRGFCKKETISCISHIDSPTAKRELSFPPLLLLIYLYVVAWMGSSVWPYVRTRLFKTFVVGEQQEV